MLKKKVSWLLSLVLVLTLALSFSVPSFAAGLTVYVGSGPYKRTLSGPSVSVSVPYASSTSENVSFYEPFEISQIVSIRNWNGGNAVQLGGVFDGFHLYTRVDISPKTVYVRNSDYVLIHSSSVYITGVSVSQEGLTYDLPVMSSSGSSYVYINHDFYTDVSSGRVSQIYDENMLLTFTGYITGYASNRKGSGSSYISATSVIRPQLDISYRFGDDRTAFIYGIDTPFVSSSDISNQTNSINNNITSNITNQTNSINNNINQATQNQTNTLTGGYDNSGMENTNKQLADSLASYDQTESQVTDQSVAYIDAVSFFDPTTHLQLMTSITYVSTFLQNLFVSLGDWSVLVMISLSLAFALMLIGWFKYRK